MSRWGLAPLCCALPWALAACGAEGPDPDDVAVLSEAATVGDYVYSSCTTSVVLGLSTQIADEVNCMAPGTLVSFPEGGGIEFTGSAVLPYLAPAAKSDLLAAIAAHGGTVQVNSAYRTVAQQYLLHRWYQEGRCGITAAATPGSSNHETGRALDVNNYSSWIGPLGEHGWSHSVPGDPVHFDHLGSPDLRGADVLAFQRLWNRNHPEDAIAEDGDYGPQTAARLAAAPAGGFPAGACPGDPAPDWDARRASASAPAEATSGDRVVVWIELENTGARTWKVGSTFLGTTHPRDHASAFHDAENWTSPARPSSVDHDAAPGELGRFSFVVKVPEVDADTVVSETFGLVEEGVTWFGPDDLTVEILVHPRSGEPADPADPVDDPAAGDDDAVGGCAAAPRSGGAGLPGALFLFLAVLFLGRRADCFPLSPRREDQHETPAHRRGVTGRRLL